MQSAAQAVPADGESDGYTLCFGMSGRPSQWSSPRPCTGSHYTLRGQNAASSGEVEEEVSHSGRRGQKVASSGLPVLAGESGEVIDVSTLAFLTRAALEERRKDEEAAAREAEVERSEYPDQLYRSLKEALGPDVSEAEVVDVLRRLQETGQLTRGEAASSSSVRKGKRERSQKRTQRTRRTRARRRWLRGAGSLSSCSSCSSSLLDRHRDGH